MKKKISIMIVAIFSIMLVSCGTLKTDYTVSELGRALNKTDSEFAKATKGLSEDELWTEEAFKMYKKSSNKNDLPFQKKITVTGKMKNSFGFFYLETSDEKYKVSCFEDADMYSKRIFINDGDDITVSGILSKDKGSYGILSDVLVTDPSKISATYKNNVGDVINDSSSEQTNTLEMGNVESIMDMSGFIKMMSAMGVDTSEYIDSDTQSVALLLPNNGSTGFSFAIYYSKELEIEAGDKIAIRGNVKSVYDFLHSDGTKTPCVAVMENIDSIFTF